MKRQIKTFLLHFASVCGIWLLAAVFLLPPQTVPVRAAETVTDGNAQTVSGGDARTQITDLYLEHEELQLSLSYQTHPNWSLDWSLEEVNALAYYGITSGGDYVPLSVLWEHNNDSVLKDTDFEKTTEGSLESGEFVFTGTLTAGDTYAFSENIEASRLQVFVSVHISSDVQPQQLYWPDDLLFFMSNGCSFARGENLAEEMASTFTSCNVSFETEDGTSVEIGYAQYDTCVAWSFPDTASMTAPGKYEASCTVKLPQEDGLAQRYLLPGAAQAGEEITLTATIHLRDVNSLTLYLETISNMGGEPVFYGSVYLPVQITESNAGENSSDEGTAEQSAAGNMLQGLQPTWYAYCGEEKPTAEQLDAMAFTEDTEAQQGDSTPFFYVDIYENSLNDGTLTIDFTERPEHLQEKEGWYAFYTVIDGVTSNYLLLDSHQPYTSAGHLEGTRGGDANSNLPETEQDPPETGGEPSGGENDDEDEADEPDPNAGEEDTSDPGTDGDEPDNGDGDDSGTGQETYPETEPAKPSERVPETDAAAKDPAIQTEEDALTDPPQTSPSDMEDRKERETDTGVTLSATRLSELIRLGNPLVVSKNGISVSISPTTLEAFALGAEDFLSVSLTWKEKDTFCLTISQNDRVLSAFSEIQVSLLELLYDSDTAWSVTHESGENISCYESGGHPAFTADASGDYTVCAEPLAESVAQPEENPRGSEHNASRQGSIGILCTVGVPALGLLLFLVHRKKRQRKGGHIHE